MKILTILFFIATQITSASDYNMSDIRELINSVKKNKYYKHINNDAGAKHYLLESSDFKSLEHQCKNDWSEIISNLDSINGSDDKRLLFWGMGQLAPEHYIILLEKLTKKYEAGKIEDIDLSNILFPSGRMKAFVVDNYDDDRVMAILNRVRAQTGDRALRERVINTLSGKAKKSLNDYRDAHAGLPEVKIPKIVLNDKERNFEHKSRGGGNKKTNHMNDRVERDSNVSKQQKEESGDDMNPFFFLAIGTLVIGFLAFTIVRRMKFRQL